MSSAEYEAHVIRAEVLTELIHAPWEAQRLRSVRKALGATPDAIVARVRALPPEKAARAIPASRLKTPWAQWFRRVLLHRAHPTRYPPPDTGGYLEIKFRASQKGMWMPHPLVYQQEKRFIIAAIASMRPNGPLSVEIQQRLRRPDWNQVIPRALLWELHPSHIRSATFRMRLMMPAGHIADLSPARAYAIPQQLFFERQTA
ncbi:MAG: hypothetical protein AAFV53_36985 [Myxococcota bacterium]